MLTEKDLQEIAKADCLTRPHVLTDNQVAWAYSKWCQGYTIPEIAKALHVCDRTIWREFKDRALRKVRKPLVYDGE